MTNYLSTSLLPDLSNGWVWLAFWVVALVAVVWLHVQHAAYGINLTWRDLGLIPLVLFLAYVATKMHAELWPGDVSAASWILLSVAALAIALVPITWAHARHLAITYVLATLGTLGWFLGVLDHALAATGGVIGTIVTGLFVLLIIKAVMDQS